jgi:transcriptional regulator with XRE-family HTH domain
MARSLFTREHDRLRRLLVEARKRAEMTQTTLAARLNRPQSYVSKYESGERRLDVIEFVEVAGALGADPAAIVRTLRRSIRT